MGGPWGYQEFREALADPTHEVTRHTVKSQNYILSPPTSKPDPCASKISASACVSKRGCRRNLFADNQAAPIKRHRELVLPIASPADVTEHCAADGA
nr:plasmid pRiA4b ORF-3 family protein [Rhizobium mesoamericanum]